MTSILTASSGAAAPNTECSAWAIQRFSGAARIEANRARATARSGKLAATRKNAGQTVTGGPGCSPAEITSHNINRAGATAAVPITVGRDASRFIGTADLAVSSVI